MSAAAISIVWFSLLEPVLRPAARAALAVRGALFNHGYLFSSPAAAIGVLTFVGMWQWTPFHTLIYQGGARAIPEVLYQAAAIDGAGRVRQFFHITLPQLRNTMITSVVLMLVGGLTTFDTILILTQGQPGHVDDVDLVLHVRTRRSRTSSSAPASVIAVLLVVVTTLISSDPRARVRLGQDAQHPGGGVTAAAPQLRRGALTRLLAADRPRARLRAGQGVASRPRRLLRVTGRCRCPTHLTTRQLLAGLPQRVPALLPEHGDHHRGGRRDRAGAGAAGCLRDRAQPQPHGDASSSGCSCSASRCRSRP